MSLDLVDLDIWGKMERRLFNTVMPAVNEEWAARVLRMTRNAGTGADLYDSEKIIEVKFSVIVPRDIDPNARNGKYVSWGVLDHQTGYGLFNDLAFYFLMATYIMDRRILDVEDGVSPSELEDMVVERESWIVTNDWVEQFKTYVQTGKTERTEWENHLKFPKKSMLPRTYKTFNVEKGMLHLTKGVCRKHFSKL